MSVLPLTVVTAMSFQLLLRGILNGGSYKANLTRFLVGWSTIVCQWVTRWGVQLDQMSTAEDKQPSAMLDEDLKPASEKDRGIFLNRSWHTRLKPLVGDHTGEMIKCHKSLYTNARARLTPSGGISASVRSGTVRKKEAVVWPPEDPCIPYISIDVMPAERIDISSGDAYQRARRRLYAERNAATLARLNRRAARDRELEEILETAEQSVINVFDPRESENLDHHHQQDNHQHQQDKHHHEAGNVEDKEE
ncbi:hypothetical protein H4Q26_003381 [Puccinia striiformis f. sp. tritici PST-130]|nr:hypothetical protein H4Q26_003381 [Puccinia striiformis f. sp. tritici PST-130]